MSMLKRYWREGACVFLATFFVYLVSRMSYGMPDTSFGRFALAAAVFACFFGMFYLLRSLWRLKWRHAVRSAFRRALGRASRFILRVIEKWSIGARKGGKTVLTAKSTVVFDSLYADVSRPKRRKKRRWKHMQTDRERLGFIYSHMIGARISGGARLRASSTPLQISRMTENTASEQELFDLYIGTRYDERLSPDPDAVQRLKRELVDGERVSQPLV